MTIIQTNLWVSKAIIESINPRNISEIDLQKIVEIEQDMWAREEWLWEYVKCKSCNTVHSKEDIFGHLAKEIRIQTVKKIEEIIDFEIVCPNCESEVKSIYDRNEYIESIRSRYNNTIESFLTVYRDENLEIRGFFDWYIDNFENIYEREFSLYYSNFWVSRIKKITKENIWVDLPEKILMCSALWMEEKYKNFFNLYDMMKFFFNKIYKLFWNNIVGIYESSIWTNTHSIYHVAGWQKLWFSNDLDLYSNIINNKKWHISDIFIHNNIAESFIMKMNIPARNFLKENRLKMKEVFKIA